MRLLAFLPNNHFAFCCLWIYSRLLLAMFVYIHCRDMVPPSRYLLTISSITTVGEALSCMWGICIYKKEKDTLSSHFFAKSRTNLHNPAQEEQPLVSLFQECPILFHKLPYHLPGMRAGFSCWGHYTPALIWADLVLWDRTKCNAPILRLWVH